MIKIQRIRTLCAGSRAIEKHSCSKDMKEPKSSLTQATTNRAHVWHRVRPNHKASLMVLDQQKAHGKTKT